MINAIKIVLSSASLCTCLYVMEYLATTNRIEPVNPSQLYDINEVKSVSEDLYNLLRIADALHAYRIDNGHYPVSIGFDGIYAKWGTSSPDWIKGLAPEYISELPIDTRQSKSEVEQYFYISNGAGYKIFSHLPADCEKVKEYFPTTIDKKRDCWGYGFWSGIHAHLW